MVYMKMDEEEQNLLNITEQVNHVVVNGDGEVKQFQLEAQTNFDVQQKQIQVLLLCSLFFVWSFITWIPMNIISNSLYYHRNWRVLFLLSSLAWNNWDYSTLKNLLNLVIYSSICVHLFCHHRSI